MRNETIKDIEESLHRLTVMESRISQSDVPDTLLALLTALKAFVTTLSHESLNENEKTLLKEISKL